MPSHYKEKLGGMAGKAEKSLGNRRRRIEEMEDEATKAMPDDDDVVEQQAAPVRSAGNGMRKRNGWPWE